MSTPAPLPADKLPELTILIGGTIIVALGVAVVIASKPMHIETPAELAERLVRQSLEHARRPAWA